MKGDKNMANAAVKPMGQMEELKQILMNLKQDAGVQIVSMVQDSFKTMDTQHQILYQELQDVKAQLNAMQETLNNLNGQSQLPVNYIVQVKNNHSIMKGLASGLEKSVSGIGKYIVHMKKGIGEKAAETIKDFKAHGVIALNNISEKLGVKELFQNAEQYFNQEADKAKASIQKLDTISKEVNETKTHASNIGRAMAGKELKAVPEEQGRLFKLLKSPYNKLLQSYKKNSAKFHDMSVKIERLELQALDAGDYLRNKSVLGKIDKFRQAKTEEQTQTHEAEQNKSSKLEDKQTGQLLLEDKQHKRDDRSER